MVQNRVTLLAGWRVASSRPQALAMVSPHSDKTIAKLRLTMPPIVSRQSVTPIWAKLNQAKIPFSCNKQMLASV
jgi:hypothetical protein